MKKQNKNKKKNSKKQKKIFPKNKKHLDKLIPFAQKIIIICREADTDPVLYGSFAHFLHTGDKKIKINDINLLVRNKDLPKISSLLNKKGIESEYIPKESKIITTYKKLRVEIDGVGFDYKTITDDSIFSDFFQRTDLAGIEVRAITLEQLEDIYSVAYNRARKDKKKILKKIKQLEKVLGRQIKNSPTNQKSKNNSASKKTVKGRVLNYFNKNKKGI